VPPQEGIASAASRTNDAEFIASQYAEALKEEEAEALEESIFKATIVMALLALAITFIGGYILEMNHIHRLPEAGVGLIVGFLLAAIAKYSGNQQMLSDEKFDFEFFMVWLLPPIIFEAGFNMNASAFFANIGPTAFFAFVGTFASTFIVGGLVWAAGQAGLCYPMGMLAALVFGSLISATDPVTVLAVFQALGVKVDLFSMVFGESVLNDAVAIVLSRTLLSFNSPAVDVNAESIGNACLLFVTIFVGSTIIGVLYGVASALVYKKLDLRHHEETIFMEASLSMTFPWAAYYTSEALELSGIVTIMACGIVMAQYTRNNFSEEAVRLTAQAYKVVAMIAETYVFVYLGMASFSFPIFRLTGYRLVVVALLACFVGRLHIYIGSWGTNCMRKTDGTTLPPITPVWQFMMWFSGLRGGVAFALASVSYQAADFPKVCGGLEGAALAARTEKGECDPHMSDSLAILQTTLLIAAFTIFVFGGAITEVAVACDVLEPKKKRKKKVVAAPPPPKAGSFDAFNQAYLMPLLTFQKVAPVESGTRFADAIEKFAGDDFARSMEPENSLWDKAKAVQVAAAMRMNPNAKEIKDSLSSEQLETALKESGMGIKEANLEDRLDDLRAKLPSFSHTQLKKLLDEAGGNVEKAIRSAPRTGGGELEML